MPLLQTIVVRPEWIMSQNPADWLTGQEKVVYEAWQSPKRRAEWLAGRLAAKSLIRDTLGLAPLTFTIGREGVAPCVFEADISPLTLSLSHSHSLGAATLSDSRQEGTAGIDIQHVRPVHHGLCERVFTRGERSQIGSHFGAENDQRGMLLFWALKEAAIKARRVAWGRPLREIEIQITEKGSAAVYISGEPTLAATYEQLEGWWLARVVRPPG